MTLPMTGDCHTGYYIRVPTLDFGQIATVALDTATNAAYRVSRFVQENKAQLFFAAVSAAVAAIAPTPYGVGFALGTAAASLFLIDPIDRREAIAEPSNLDYIRAGIAATAFGMITSIFHRIFIIRPIEGEILGGILGATPAGIISGIVGTTSLMSHLTSKPAKTSQNSSLQRTS